MKIAYVRVSTEEQNEARQVATLEQYGIERWYKEKISGKNKERPRLKEMLDFAREGDTIYVLDFSRLARNVRDLLDIIDCLDTKNVDLVSYKENIDTSTPTGKLMITMIGAINEFERAIILERQQEGIAIAKQNGKYKGRKRFQSPEFFSLYKDYQSRKISLIEMAQKLGVSRPTVYRMIREQQQR